MKTCFVSVFPPSDRGLSECRYRVAGKMAVRTLATAKTLDLLASLSSAKRVNPEHHVDAFAADRPVMPERVESVWERFRGSDCIQFTEHLREEAIPELFNNTAMRVMPDGSAGRSKATAPPHSLVFRATALRWVSWM